jgi:hypothetical protein
MDAHVGRADAYARMVVAEQRAAGALWRKNATLLAMRQHSGKLLQRVDARSGWRNPNLVLERVTRGFHALPRSCATFFHEHAVSAFGVPARRSDKDIFKPETMAHSGFWDAYVSLLTIAPTSMWKSRSNPITVALVPSAEHGLLCKGSNPAVLKQLILQATNAVDRFDTILNVKEHFEASQLLVALTLGVVLDSNCGEQSLHPALQRHPCKNGRSSAAARQTDTVSNGAARSSNVDATLELKDHYCDDAVIAHANRRLVSMAAIVRRTCSELSGLAANDTRGCLLALGAHQLHTFPPTVRESNAS